MKRDYYWDSLKFVLIYFVVLFHCIQGYRPSGGINLALCNFILSFVMPSFIFVSGMFSRIKDREKYKKGILRILETYVVFQFIGAVIPMFLSGNVTLMSVAHCIAIPGFALWYLLSLICYRLIVLYMPEKTLRDNPIGIMLTCFMVSLLGVFIPVGREFSLQRTLIILPFFFMGYYAKDIDVKKYIAKIPPIIALGVLLSAFLFFFILNKNVFFILSVKVTSWANAEFSPFLLCLFRFVFLLSAIMMGAMVMRLVLVRPFFSQWGQVTLFIYIYHTFFIKALRFVIKHGYLPQNEWIYWVMSVTIMTILIYLSKIKFFNILLNPLSYILEKYRICKS